MKYRMYAAALAVALSNLFSAAHAQPVLHAGVVDGADVMFAAQFAAFNQSAFKQALDEQQSEELREAAKETQQKFTEATGLEEEDLDSLVFSANLSNLDLEAMDQDAFLQSQAVLAVQLNKAVTLDQLQAGLEIMQEDAPTPASFTREQLDGSEVLVMHAPEQEFDDGGPDKVFGTLSPDGQTVMLSLNTESLSNSLSRVSDGRAGRPNPEMTDALRQLANQQLQLAMVLPENMRQAIAQGAQAAGQQDPMASMMIAPFADLRSVLVGANATDTLAVNLMLDLGNEQAAQQGLGMVQNMLPMLLMGAGPNGQALAQKLDSGTEGSVMKFSIDLAPADLDFDPTGGQGGMHMEMEEF